MRRGHRDEVSGVHYEGAETARAAPGVLEALGDGRPDRDRAEQPLRLDRARPRSPGDPGGRRRPPCPLRRRQPADRRQGRERPGRPDAEPARRRDRPGAGGRLLRGADRRPGLRRGRRGGRARRAARSSRRRSWPTSTPAASSRRPRWRPRPHSDEESRSSAAPAASGAPLQSAGRERRGRRDRLPRRLARRGDRDRARRRGRVERGRRLERRPRDPRRPLQRRPGHRAGAEGGDRSNTAALGREQPRVHGRRQSCPASTATRSPSTSRRSSTRRSRPASRPSLPSTSPARSLPDEDVLVCGEADAREGSLPRPRRAGSSRAVRSTPARSPTPARSRG